MRKKIIAHAAKTIPIVDVNGKLVVNECPIAILR
jgi:hypothetical protein